MRLENYFRATYTKVSTQGMSKETSQAIHVMGFLRSESDNLCRGHYSAYHSVICALYPMCCLGQPTPSALKHRCTALRSVKIKRNDLRAWSPSLAACYSKHKRASRVYSGIKIFAPHHFATSHSTLVLTSEHS
jgi:hypothetical protein